MNYHSDEWIMERVREHYKEALEYFPEDRIVGLFYQGSGNYGLDTPTSDVDTKLIVTPTFHELAMNKQPVSTTHVRANDEHIDFKDVRLYIQTFRKQNLNFLEILFTPYAIVNPLYKVEWDRLVEAREEITHYDSVRAIKSMQGVAYTKYKQLENESPSHIEAIKKFGYSPKELHHLFRVEEYISRYIVGESYADCLLSRQAEYLKRVKEGFFTLDDARFMAKVSIDTIDKMCAEFLETCNPAVNEDVNELLDDVQYNIMKIAIEKEIR
jgi:predicted nucleotidyltransferase